MSPISRVGAGGRYRVRELLGVGGMARVYRAEDQESGRAVAVKLVHVGDARVRAHLGQRLRAEARAMSRIAHPNVLAIHEVGEEGEVDFIVMDLAEGGSLKQRLDRDGPMPPGVALSFVVQMLSALAAAHAAGIIHRDVKPHNVLLDGDDRALLADFGIAMFAREDQLRATRSNATLGSLWFMPPEQRLDPRFVDATADVYACGCSLYNLLTDANPMDLFQEPDSSKRWGGIPDALRRIIQRATAQSPTDRYPSAEAMARDLIAALEALPAEAHRQALRPRRAGTPDSALNPTVEERQLPALGTTHIEDADSASASFRESDPVRSAITFLIEDIEDLREQVAAGTLLDDALMAELRRPELPEPVAPVAPEPVAAPPDAAPAPPDAAPAPKPVDNPRAVAGALAFTMVVLLAGWWLLRG